MKGFSPRTAEADIRISSPPYLNRYSVVQLTFGDEIRTEALGVPRKWKN